jgi:hypothetical protein
MEKRLNPLPEAAQDEPEQTDRDTLDVEKADPTGPAALRSTSYDNSLEAIGADNFRGKEPNKEEDRQG